MGRGVGFSLVGEYMKIIRAGQCCPSPDVDLPANIEEEWAKLEAWHKERNKTYCDCAFLEAEEPRGFLRWGTGLYTVESDGIMRCIASDWDSSG